MAEPDLSAVVAALTQIPPPLCAGIDRVVGQTYNIASRVPARLESINENLARLARAPESISQQLRSIGSSVSGWDFGGMTEGLRVTIPDSIGTVAARLEDIRVATEAVSGSGDAAANAVREGLERIGQNMYDMAERIAEGEVEINIKSLCNCVEGAQLVSETLTGLFGSLASLVPKDLGKLFEDLEKLVPMLMGDTAVGDQSKKGTLAGALAEADLDVALDTWGVEHESPAVVQAIVKAIWSRITEAAGFVSELFSSKIESAPGFGAVRGAGGLGPGMGDLGSFLLSPIKGLTKGGVATPDGVVGRCVTAYGFSVGLGVLAHVISALGSLQIHGSGALRFSGLAALVGKFAGFQPLTNAVSGTLYRNYISVPLNYYTNQFARPYIPSIGDVLRFHYKRMFTRLEGDPCTVKAPYTFAQCMAYYGFSDQWIKLYEDDLYREPSARDLLLMAEFLTPKKGWWKYKARRLGYAEGDIDAVVGGFERRAARTQIMDLVRAWRNLFEQGFVSEESYRDGLAETRIPELAIDLAVQAGKMVLELNEARDTLAYAKDQYRRDAIDDREFRAFLDGVFEEPKQAKRVFLQERIKRFRSVPLLSESDEVRAALPLYKQAFLAESITLPEYRAKLSAAGVTGDVLELTLELDEKARDRAVLARFQRFGLPALADEALHGLISVGEYVGALRKAAFPQEHLHQARALIEAQIQRRQEQTVRTGQLPAYRSAYVVGLISAGTLSRAFRDAGVDPDSIRAERTVLDYQRDQAELRREETDRREEEARLEKQRREDEREKKEWEREEQARQRRADRLRKAKEKQRAEDARKIAEALKRAAEERRPGWPAEVARIHKQIDSAYKRTGGLLPDDVWSLGLDLEDELARVPDPDPVAVDSLIGRIEQALARHAGVLPTPEPEAATA